MNQDPAPACRVPDPSTDEPGPLVVRRLDRHDPIPPVKFRRLASGREPPGCYNRPQFPAPPVSPRRSAPGHHGRPRPRRAGLLARSNLVDTSHGLTDERLLVELEKQVRPLVAAARTALGELIAPGREAAARFLDAAPTAECVRLAGIWAGASAMGLDTSRVKARFSPEDQMLIEIVVALTYFKSQLFIT